MRLSVPSTARSRATAGRVARVRREGAEREADHDHLVGGEGKICPVCASRYALEAQVCGRDGSELVTVN